MFVRFHLEPTAGPTLGATSRPTASTPWVPVGPAPGHRQFLSRFGSAVATSFARQPEDVLKTGREIGEVPGYTAPPCRAPPSPPEPQPPSPVPIHERLDPAVHGCVGHPPPLQLRPRDGPVTPGVAVATALGVGTTVILMERIGNIHSRRRHGVSRDRTVIDHPLFKSSPLAPILRCPTGGLCTVVILIPVIGRTAHFL